MPNNKGISQLWGYGIIDKKARDLIKDTRNSLDSLYQKKNDDILTTTSKTVPGAINEINAQCKDIENKTNDYLKKYA